MRGLEERRAEVRAQRWRDAESSARRLAEDGALHGLPSARDYATWSDERIAALRADPEAPLDVPEARHDDLETHPGDHASLRMPGAFLDEGDPWSDAEAAVREVDEPDWEDEAVETLDVHPLNLAVERVEEAQREVRLAEATRVQAALCAWRIAMATVAGTPDAMINGVFHKSVMLQLATSLQVAEQTASALVHAADDLEHRLPKSWTRFVAGDVPWRGMQRAHAAIEGLDARFWGAFDDAAAHALVHTAMPKLRDRLHVIRERIQATTAADRHAKALGRMGVTIEPLPDGLAAITAILPAPEAVQIDLRLDLAARAAASTEGETRSIGELRAHIVMDVIDEGLFRDARTEVEDLAVPQRRGVQCKVGLLIPAMTAMGHSEVPATLEGYGPIDIETAKRLAANATSWIKVLTDPVTGAVQDIGRQKYRPTDDMRALLGLLDGGGRGPNCTRPPAQTEADHVEPFRQRLARGRTALDNLVLLSRRDHRIKTSGLWDIELREHRELAWTSFFGTRIITTVEPLEPTPVPPEFLTPSAAPPGAAPIPPGTADGWAEPNAADDLDYPF